VKAWREGERAVLTPRTTEKYAQLSCVDGSCISRYFCSDLRLCQKQSCGPAAQQLIA
jgi:hypothetical protein